MLRDTQTEDRFRRLHSHWPIRSFTAVQPAYLLSPEKHICYDRFHRS